MLKRAAFSPTRPRRAETRFFPYIVLVSLEPSTYRGEPLGCGKHWRGFSVRQDPSKGRTAHTKCGMYLLGLSLTAALLKGPFEHPLALGEIETAL